MFGACARTNSKALGAWRAGMSMTQQSTASELVSVRMVTRREERTRRQNLVLGVDERRDLVPLEIRKRNDLLVPLLLLLPLDDLCADPL